MASYLQNDPSHHIEFSVQAFVLPKYQLISFLQRQVAGTRIVISLFIVSDPSRVIWSQQDNNGQSRCKVALMLPLTCCSNPRNRKTACTVCYRDRRQGDSFCTYQAMSFDSILKAQKLSSQVDTFFYGLKKLEIWNILVKKNRIKRRLWH